MTKLNNTLYKGKASTSRELCLCGNSCQRQSFNARNLVGALLLAKEA